MQRRIATFVVGTVRLDRLALVGLSRIILVRVAPPAALLEAVAFRGIFVTELRSGTTSVVEPTAVAHVGRVVVHSGGTRRTAVEVRVVESGAEAGPVLPWGVWNVKRENKLSRNRQNRTTTE
jgi:hypothetical protein